VENFIILRIRELADEAAAILLLKIKNTGKPKKREN
jgi:hypothetical protein